MKEILSHLLADAEARSLVSDSFPKMHINNKINVSVKAMCLLYLELFRGGEGFRLTGL